jgi:hypothetical protein
MFVKYLLVTSLISDICVGCMDTYAQHTQKFNFKYFKFNNALCIPVECCLSINYFCSRVNPSPQLQRVNYQITTLSCTSILEDCTTSLS